MDLNQYISNLSNIKFSRKNRIILLALYAIIMFSAIVSEINLIVFILLFAIVPISIYFIVKQIFPKDK